VFTKTLKPVIAWLRHRPTAYGVPGRHAIYACQKGPTRDNGSTAMQVIQISGIDGEHPEVPTNPSSTNKILGVSDQLRLNVNQPAIREGQEDPTGGSKIPEVTYNLSTGAGYVHRENSGNLQSCYTSPTTLQGPTDGPQFSSTRGQSSG